MIPRCCVCCDPMKSGKSPEVKCAPENLMVARMINKCPKFEPLLAQVGFSTLHQGYMKKYRLETENDP